MFTPAENRASLCAVDSKAIEYEIECPTPFTRSNSAVGLGGLCRAAGLIISAGRRTSQSGLINHGPLREFGQIEADCVGVKLRRE